LHRTLDGKISRNSGERLVWAHLDRRQKQNAFNASMPTKTAVSAKPIICVVLRSTLLRSVNDSAFMTNLHQPELPKPSATDFWRHCTLVSIGRLKGGGAYTQV
jgi:hypothetical protein